MCVYTINPSIIYFYSRTLHIRPQNNRHFGKTDLLNCECFPLKSVLNLVPTLKKPAGLDNDCSKLHDYLILLDVIAVYSFLGTNLITVFVERFYKATNLFHNYKIVELSYQNVTTAEILVCPSVLSVTKKLLEKF